MASVADKYADNVPGAFYVDKQCILCHLCSDIAPAFFKESADGDHDYVHNQPKSAERCEKRPRSSAGSGRWGTTAAEPRPGTERRALVSRRAPQQPDPSPLR